MLFRWLQKHQVMGFFLITFIFTWTSWILGFLLFPDDELIQGLFFKVGVFAPAGVSIFISRIINREIYSGKTRNRWVVFSVVWLVAWFHLLLYANVANDLLINGKLIIVGGLIAAFPAYVISAAFSRNIAVRSLLDSIIKPRGKAIWYLLAVFVIPSIMALGSVISLALGNSLPIPDQAIQDAATLEVLGMIALVFFNEFIQAGGLPEEVGWRGFALPRLQIRFSPLAASILLGFFWSLWHGPLLIGMVAEAGPWRMILRILMIGVSFTWLYNKTRGSLLAVMLLHASWNTALVFLPRTDAFLILMSVLTTLVVILDRMWRRLPAGHPSLYPGDADTLAD